MSTLDLRSRSDDEITAVDVVEFFEEELPALAADRSHLAVPGALELDVEPMAIDTPRGTWTLSIAGESVRVLRGAGAAAMVQLDQDDLTEIVFDRQTPMTHLAAGTLNMPRGSLGAFLDWWVVLRSLVDGRPVYTAGSVDFVDRSGAPLDLRRSFTTGDDPADAAQFLAQAGFLHLSGVYSEEEMAQISADMDVAFASYRPDDGRSWWARTAGGEHRPVRLEWFQEHSPATAALLSDDRFLRIARLTHDGHVARTEGNLIEALVKPIGVVEGISDLPWHKDCALGRHSYECCGLTVGISVTGADEYSGQLAVVAGSHRALVQPAFVRRSWQLPQIDLPTRTGDVTVHCSCTLHMSHPPVESERRVMYTGFSLPPRAAGAARKSIGSLGRIREQAHKVVSQTPGHIG